VRRFVRAEIVLMAVAFLCLASGQSQGQQQQPSSSPKKTTTSAVHTSSSSSEGERRFQANCGRCHQAPQDLSPREVKAVIQHMRVRAMLSAEDEQLILKYLAP
jgi:hypothetical protein